MVVEKKLKIMKLFLTHYIKENSYMEKKLGKGKIILILLVQFMKVNFYMIKRMEREKNIIIIDLIIN